MKVGQFVMVYYWDHNSTCDHAPTAPMECKTPGWIYAVVNTEPAHIIVAHDCTGDCKETENLVFPFTTLLKADIIRIVKLKKSK